MTETIQASAPAKSGLLHKLKHLVSEQRRQLAADRAVYTRMLQYLQPYKTRFIVGMIASLPASAMESLYAFSIGPLTDHMMKQGGDVSFVLIVVPVIIGANIIQGVFEYLSQYCVTYVGNRISVDIQSHLYKHLLGMDLGYYKGNTYGEITTRYFSDAQKLQQAIVTNLQGLLIQVFTAITLAAVLLYRNWQLSIIAILIISLIVIPLAYISKRIRELDYLNRQAAAMVGNLFNETIYGVREVKSFTLNGFMGSRFNKVRQAVFDTTMNTAKKNIILSPIMTIIASVGISAILCMGVIYVKYGLMTVGDLLSFLAALVLMYKPVKVVGSTIGKISVILAPAERVFQIMDTEPSMKTPENPVEIGPFESLEFRRVDFAYQAMSKKKKKEKYQHKWFVRGVDAVEEAGQEKQVLHDINLTIRAGETIGLVGTSGGGKSTLVDLISRFIDPTSGAVLMNGVDLRELNLKELRGRIAMVSQETMMFGGTIRDNIMLGRPDATEAELQEAVRVAHLADWVATLQDGLDTTVGDRGSFLSGGQKQRVAIARAYLKNAPILVLDEATSALDNESEAIVQSALMGLVAGRTVITVAHRLSTIRHADRILVIEGGHIREAGTHEELMAINGTYARLYSLQFRNDKAADLETLMG